MAAHWRSVLSALRNPEAPEAVVVVALGAADLALRGDPGATASDVHRIALDEFSLDISPDLAASALAYRRGFLTGGQAASTSA